MFEASGALLLNSALDLPGLPPAASQALADADLLHILKADPLLAAHIDRVAGAAGFHVEPGPQDSRGLIERIGIPHVRNLLVGLSTLRCFDNYFSGAPYSRAQFWRHSIGVGVVAARLARAAGDLSPSLAFLAGLLHDVGKPVLDRRCRPAWNAALRMSREGRLPLHEAESRLLGRSHAAVGAAFLGLWKLPEEVVAPVRSHHDPGACPERHRRLAMALQIADYLCIERRVGGAGNAWPELPSPFFMDALRLTEGVLAASLEGLDQDILFADLLG